MDDERQESSPLDEGSEMIAHSAQAAYAVSAAVKAGGTASGVAAGTAMAGPLGTLVGTLAGSKTVWKVFGAIFLFLFLWMFIIANMIGIIFNYLGFATADSYANEAQSNQLANIRNRAEQILQNADYQNEILQIIGQQRDLHLQEIQADQMKKYAHATLVVVDEFETKLKRSLSYYLSVMLMDKCDNSTISSFLGYSNVLGLDMDTNLSSPYDAYFQEAARTYNVPVALLLAICKTESDFNPNVVSGAGAIGLMQLMPETAASLGVSNPYDPYQNIMGGAKFISQLVEQFKGYSNGLELAVAGYNAGPYAVIKYGYQVPPYSETQAYVKKVLGLVEIHDSTSGTSTEIKTDQESLEKSYQVLKEAVAQNVDSFFSWTVTDEWEGQMEQKVYCLDVNGSRAETDEQTYRQVLEQGGNVWEEKRTVTTKVVEYTLALILNTQLTGSSGYQYKYVTNESTFNFVLKLLEYLQGGVEAVKNALYNVFHWTDFLTGGTSGSDTYIGNIDATGDIITYDTVGKGVKKVVYYNQGEDPWATMSYGASTIKASGCGPTSLAIVISTLTGQTVTPEMTCAFSIANGEYIYGLGTCHSFPMNAAHHWGLNCERVGKDRMGDIVNALKDGKMVVEICEAYTITGSGSGHFIVLTGVTKDGYITIADCASMVICYQEKGITHDNQSLFDPTKPGGYRKMPILGDLHEVLLRKEECKRLANILNRLVNGSAASFNQQTNVDLNNKYVVLDISELSGDLLIGMFVALDYVWSRTKEDRTREKAIFIDEAWKLLSSNELAADYIQGIYKTIRAYGGAAISASQDLVDYYELNGGKIGRGILSNAKTKIILNLEVAEAELIQKELDLSEAEFNSIVHFERGCGLISTNSNNLVVEFKASQLEKDLITTDRKDLQKLKGRIQKYGESAYGNTE